VANIVATGLLNADMPLIRYEVGDRGQQENSSQCQCGRVLPVLDKVEGRANDLIVTKDGRKIFWLNPIFYGMPIIEAQIVQKSVEQILIQIVPTSTYTDADGNMIVTRLLERVGEMNIELELVKQIPRSANGKLRAIISHVRG
jgi:phenylacetate-CoA ligase